MLNGAVQAFKQTMTGKKVTVIGIGVSNIPALKFLSDCGAIITACDKRTEDKLDEAALEAIRKNCDFSHLGEDYLDHLEGEDIILKAPGVNPALPQLVAAAGAGCEITSEMEIFMSLCPCKMIGVTGSDGKTTTTTLIYEILKAEGHRCHIGGNIGTPLLGKLDEITPDDMVILELSSFQLMNMRVSPHVSVITNISPNHLDYHKDMSEYVDAKTHIFKHHTADDKLIINKDNSITASFRGKQAGKCEMFSRRYTDTAAYVEDGYLCYNGERIVHADEIKIKGWHNVENFLAAICATMEFAGKEAIATVARTFPGVAHRMEYVRTVEEINFYNDSIGSSPTRTIAGLVAQNDDVVLIAGGKDKNLNYDELGRIIREKVKVLVLIGATADKIEASVLKAYGSRKAGIPIARAEKYEEAVKMAFLLAKGIKREDNKVSVILSPASTSFDMFRNFEERGNCYKKLVWEL